MPVMVSMTGNIFLVGLMGAGKTTVGKSLAKKLNRPFVDADHVLVERTGVKIPVIFEIEGEAGFRAREHSILQELASLKNVVLATGGGVVLNADNRKILRANGTVVYLRASPEELWRRTQRDKNRPLLQTADPLATLRRLHAERDPLYREVAHIVIDSGSQKVARLVALLEKKLAEAAPDQLSA